MTAERWRATERKEESFPFNLYSFHLHPIVLNTDLLKQFLLRARVSIWWAKLANWTSLCTGRIWQSRKCNHSQTRDEILKRKVKTRSKGTRKFRNLERKSGYLWKDENHRFNQVVRGSVLAGWRRVVEMLADPFRSVAFLSTSTTLQNDRFHLPLNNNLTRKNNTNIVLDEDCIGCRYETVDIERTIRRDAWIVASYQLVETVQQEESFHQLDIYVIRVKSTNHLSVFRFRDLIQHLLHF